MKRSRQFTIILMTLISTFVFGQSPQSKLKTFSSKTKQYFVKVELQFSDTILINFTLNGNCKKKCNFSFSGHPKKIGATQNVSIPNGNNFITTEYAFYNDIYTFVFEISDGNNSTIKLRGIQANKDKSCEECLKSIIMGQVIVPLEKQ